MMLQKFLNSKYYLTSIIIFSFIAILLTSQITLKNFPNSADEYAYLTMAETFAQGKISVPSPLNKEFFDFMYLINDGKFYGKYPPGWPFFLALGTLIKMPMIINPIFALLTLIITYLITKEISLEKTAKLSLLLMATSPYFILNSASYFSHPSSLFFTALAAYLYIKNLKLNNKANYLIIGLTLGILFNIRPLDSISISSCLFMHYLFMNIKNKKPLKKEIKNILLSLTGFSILLSIFFLYNNLQTGNPFLMPFTKYNTNDKLGFGTYSSSFSWAIENNIYQRLIQLNVWIPFCLLFVLITLFSKNKCERKWLLFSIFLITLLTYFFYAFSPGDQYGPRYLYCSAFAIYILTAAGLKKVEKRLNTRLITVIIIILNITLLIYASMLVGININNRSELYQIVKNSKISNAIIFSDYEEARNSIYFNSPILYAHNMNEKNFLLIQQYPNRKYYFWKCEELWFEQDKLTQIFISKNKNCALTQSFNIL